MKPDRKRRALLGAMAALVVVRPAFGTPVELAAAIRDYAGGAAPREGKVTLDVAQLVDNGNAVPVTVRVDVPAGRHVTGIALFNERNPQADVGRFTLGPRAGKAEVSTRIRLATSQKLVALAKLDDGSVWQATAEVAVTLAACIEEIS